MDALDLQEKYKSYYTAAEQPELVKYLKRPMSPSLGKEVRELRTSTEKKAIPHSVNELEKHWEDADQAFSRYIVEAFYWSDYGILAT